MNSCIATRCFAINYGNYGKKFVVMLSIIGCNDNLPADYDTSAVTCGLSWTCQEWAEVNACGYKWNSWEFGGCSASSAKIMDHCKASCNNCGKYFTYLYNILH